MLLIECPWCGQRDQTEFSAHGEAHIARPLDTEQLSDEQWGDYVFFRTNAKGLHYERWVQRLGVAAGSTPFAILSRMRFCLLYTSPSPRDS